MRYPAMSFRLLKTRNSLYANFVQRISNADLKRGLEPRGMQLLSDLMCDRQRRRCNTLILSFVGDRGAGLLSDRVALPQLSRSKTEL